VEGGLEVLADEVDPVAERAGDQGGRGQEDERRVPGAMQDADQRRRLPLARARHDLDVRHDLGITDLRHRLPQQVVGDGEVEQRIVEHCPGTLSLTPASGRARDLRRRR
jgi:hypothetical protein